MSRLKLTALAVFALVSTSGCVALTAADLAVGATGAVVGTTGKVVGTAVDVATPGKTDIEDKTAETVEANPETEA